MFARGFPSLSTPHLPAAAQNSANSSYSRTYAPFDRNSNHSRTYAYPRGEGSYHFANSPRVIPKSVHRYPHSAAKSPVSPRSTRPVHKSFISPTSAKTGGCPRSKMSARRHSRFFPSNFALFPVLVAQAFLPVQPIGQQPSIANSRIPSPPPFPAPHGTRVTDHFSSPNSLSLFPPRGLQCARTFPTRGE